jgi:hypothetical protein
MSSSHNVTFQCGIGRCTNNKAEISCLLCLHFIISPFSAAFADAQTTKQRLGQLITSLALELLYMVIQNRYG